MAIDIVEEFWKDLNNGLDKLEELEREEKERNKKMETKSYVDVNFNWTDSAEHLLLNKNEVKLLQWLEVVGAISDDVVIEYHNEEFKYKTIEELI